MENPPDGLVERPNNADWYEELSDRVRGTAEIVHGGSVVLNCEIVSRAHVLRVAANLLPFLPVKQAIIASQAARIRELEGERSRKQKIVTILASVPQPWRGMIAELDRLHRAAEAALTETLKERDEARASANHQRKQKQASNISRNRAAQGVEYWKARAERMEGALREADALLWPLSCAGSDKAARAHVEITRALSPPPSPQDLGSACCDQERTGTPAPPSSGPSDLEGGAL